MPDLVLSAFVASRFWHGHFLSSPGRLGEDGGTRGGLVNLLATFLAGSIVGLPIHRGLTICPAARFYRMPVAVWQV